MDTEDFTFDNGTNTKIVEDLCAVLPRVSISVLSNCLIVEPIDGCDLSGLVITSKESDVSWVFHLKAQKKLESFDGVESSINKISHENVFGIGNLTTFVKDLKKIMKLSMDISTDSNRSLNGLDVAFFNENFFYFLTKNSKISLRKDCSFSDGLKPVVDILSTHF